MLAARKRFIRYQIEVDVTGSIFHVIFRSSSILIRIFKFIFI